MFWAHCAKKRLNTVQAKLIIWQLIWVCIFCEGTISSIISFISSASIFELCKGNKIKGNKIKQIENYTTESKRYYIRKLSDTDLISLYIITFDKKYRKYLCLFFCLYFINKQINYTQTAVNSK